MPTEQRHSKNGTGSPKNSSKGASVKVETALISVSNKDGLVEFGQGLAELGINIYSTGKTYDTLEAALGAVVHEAGGQDKLPQLVEKGMKERSTPISSQLSKGTAERDTRILKRVSEYIGEEEALNGRVKTLDRRLFEGILTPERGERQRREFKNGKNGNGAPILDMVNFYPFEDMARRPKVSDRLALETVDIGGPAMVRSAAKNYHHVIVVVDTEDYSEVLRRIRHRTNTSTWRQGLALKAWQLVAQYDLAIAAFFEERWAKKKTSLAR